MDKSSNSILVIFICIFFYSNNIIYSQFKSNFSIDQFFYPFVNLTKDKRLIITHTSGSEIVKIAQFNLVPRAKKLPNGRRPTECYFVVLDSLNNLSDSFQIFSTKDLKVISGFLDNSGNYYFAVSGPDTLYYNNEIYLNPYADAIFQVYVFQYNINTHILTLCKVIGNAEGNTCLYADERNIYIGVKYTLEAIVDTTRYNSLLQGSIHEHDLLVLRLNVNDFQIEQGNTILGWDENIPLYITADSDQNIYLTSDIYSSFIIYNKDTINFKNIGIGNGLYSKMTKKGVLEWYHNTESLFLKSITLENGSTHVLGNYINNLNIDSLTLSVSPNIEDGFIISFQPNGDYSGIITFQGKGAKRLNILKKDNSANIILAGQFEEEITESNPISMCSKGGNDSYIYFTNPQGEIKASFYFQGDSTEYIEDISLLKNGNILVLGYTFSDTVFCRNDTLITGNHNKNYFIYEIPARLLNYTSEKFLDDNSIKVYPTTFQDYFNIDCSKIKSFNNSDCVIYNQGGIKLKSFQLKEAINSIYMRSLPSGIYLIQIRDQKGIIYTQKINKI